MSITKPNVVTLDVSLDTTANPPVTVDEPAKDLSAAEHLRWIEADDSVDFDFKDLNINQEVFPDQRVSVIKRRISCANKGIIGEFKYKGGQSYSSTPQDRIEPGGKPVIRNQ
jgi:hypothetical protein